MSLSTNSWDIVYTSKLNVVNNALGNNIVNKTKKIIKWNDAGWVFTKFEVKIDTSGTSATELKLNLDLEGYHNGLALPTSLATTILFTDFNSKNYTAFKTQTTTPNAAALLEFIGNNELLHVYFSNLGAFQEHGWINPVIVRIKIQDNTYEGGNPVPTYISFCYMLSRMENGIEKAINYNEPFVDFNAVPVGATSALVIERSVFGEYMVKAAFGTVGKDNIDTDIDIDVPDPNDPNKTKKAKKKANTFDGELFKGLEADGDLVKAGTYAFSNNKKIELKSTDYKNEYGTPVGGKVEAERLLLSIEESNIKLSMGDVGYTYNDNSWKSLRMVGQNHPTINQEYMFDLKWDATAKQIVASGKEKLFIISNDFNSDKTWEFLVNIGVPVLKNALLEPLIWAAHNRGFEPTTFIKIIEKKKKTKLNQIAQSPSPKLVTTRTNVKSTGFKQEDLNESQSQLIENPEKQPLSGRDRENARKISADFKDSVIKKSSQNNNQNPEEWDVEIELPTLKKDVKKCYLTHFFAKIDEYLLICKEMKHKLDLAEKKRQGGSDHQDFEKEIDYFNKWIRYFKSVNKFSKAANLKNDEFILFYDRLLETNKNYKQDNYQDDYTIQYDYSRVQQYFSKFKDFDSNGGYYLFQNPDPGLTGMWTTWKISLEDAPLKQKYSTLYQQEWENGYLLDMPLDNKYGFIKLIAEFYRLTKYHSSKKFQTKK